MASKIVLFQDLTFFDDSKNCVNILATRLATDAATVHGVSLYCKIRKFCEDFFCKTLPIWSFEKIKPWQNVQNSLLLADVGKSSRSGDYKRGQYVLMLFTKKNISKFTAPKLSILY